MGVRIDESGDNYLAFEIVSAIALEVRVVLEVSSDRNYTIPVHGHRIGCHTFSLCKDFSVKQQTPGRQTSLLSSGDLPLSVSVESCPFLREWEWHICG